MDEDELLARTIDAISDRVSPKRNVERAKVRFRERVSQVDPLSALADLDNLYAYVGNDPVNRVDPLGLWWQTALSESCTS